jgi:hypothetical protein
MFIAPQVFENSGRSEMSQRMNKSRVVMNMSLLRSEEEFSQRTRL